MIADHKTSGQCRYQILCATGALGAVAEERLADLINEQQDLPDGLLQERETLAKKKG